MSDNVLDDLEPIITPIRQALIAVGLPLRILEAEWGPGQIEISLDPLENMAAADAVVILRAAVKQVARGLGLLASFMAKPALSNVYSSGWHLHLSLSDTATGKNAFAEAGALMSDTGLHFVGGLLEHARAATAFSNPTMTGYKRLNANPLAPNRVVWSCDNKGAMCRLVEASAIRQPTLRTGPAIRQPIPTSTWARKSSLGWTAWQTGSIPAAPCRTPTHRRKGRRCRAA
jgi:glutamine synthetase